MTKKELIKNVAESLEMTQKEVSAVVDNVLETIVVAVSEGEEIRISGFGKFERAVQKGREGIINMGSRAGETYKTDDKFVPKFKPAKEFKETVSAK